MAKVFEEESATNIVQDYQLENMRSPAALESLVGTIMCTRGCEILHMELLDTSERFSEGADCKEVRIADAKRLADIMKRHRVDAFSMLVDYCGTDLALGVDLEDWTVSIAGDKGQNIELEAFAKAIGLDA